MTQPYTHAWQRYRKQYLADHPLCARCARYGRKAKSTSVDHIKPHHGDQKLFWDPANHQALCNACHYGDKTEFEKTGRVIWSARGVNKPSRANKGCTADGLPIDPAHHWNRRNG